MLERLTSALFGLLLMLVAGSGAAARAADLPATDGRGALEAELGQLVPWARHEPVLRAILEVYAARDHRPLWFAGSRLNQAAQALARELQQASRHGLRPSDYLEGVRAAAAADLATIELTLTEALIRYASDLARGRVEPGVVDAALDIEAPPFSARDLLVRIGAGTSVRQAVEQAVPVHPGYEPLRRYLLRLRTIADRVDWPVLEPGPTLEVGDHGPAVRVLRRMLILTGDLTESLRPDQPERFDHRLGAAVERFQERHGLKADGKVGPKTRAALAIPLSDRVAQIALNLERLRWASGDLGRRHLFINLADFSLRMVEGGRPVFKTRVVVGTPYHRTPVFTGQMTYLEINPYWNIPPSIARNEILPPVKADPTYLIVNDIEVLDDWSQSARVLDPSSIAWRTLDDEAPGIRFRQKPGPKNALGRIKFMFPNEYNVYLHDTPARFLFDHSVRSFSHGCIRVEEPETLAALLLRDQPGWTRAGILRVIERGERTIIGLDRPIPVHITYLTSWVDDSNQLNFRDDIYGRDERLRLALDAPSPALLIDGAALDGQPDLVQ